MCDGCNDSRCTLIARHVGLCDCGCSLEYFVPPKEEEHRGAAGTRPGEEGLKEDSTEADLGPESSDFSQNIEADIAAEVKENQLRSQIKRIGHVFGRGLRPKQGFVLTGARYFPPNVWPCLMPKESKYEENDSAQNIEENKKEAATVPRARIGTQSSPMG